MSSIRSTPYPIPNGYDRTNEGVTSVHKIFRVPLADVNSSDKSPKRCRTVGNNNNNPVAANNTHTTARRRNAIAITNTPTAVPHQMPRLKCPITPHPFTITAIAHSHHQFRQRGCATAATNKHNATAYNCGNRIVPMSTKSLPAIASRPIRHTSIAANTVQHPTNRNTGASTRRQPRKSRAP